MAGIALGVAAAFAPPFLGYLAYAKAPRFNLAAGALVLAASSYAAIMLLK